MMENMQIRRGNIFTAYIPCGTGKERKTVLICSNNRANKHSPVITALEVSEKERIGRLCCGWYVSDSPLIIDKSWIDAWVMSVNGTKIEALMNRICSDIEVDGMCFIADLGIFNGSSVQSGRRPVVLIRRTRNGIMTVIPVTSRVKKSLPTHVGIDHIFRTSSIALTEQIMSVPSSCIDRYIGKVKQEDAKEIKDAMCIQMGV